MTQRNRGDLCPGVLRPWPAADGMLVRLRLIGGRVSSASLLALLEVAEHFGDGRVHLTSRANLQVRALPGARGELDAAVLTAIESTGLLPTRTHELVRNVMVSPQTGLAGGRVDLRPVAVDLDTRLCAAPELTGLPGRFLIVLDDGRGDLVSRSCDLGLVALDAESVQLRVGDEMGPVVSIGCAAEHLTQLAREFAVRRGAAPSAPWHVVEMTDPLVGSALPDPRLPEPTSPLPFGQVPGGWHAEVAREGLDRGTVSALTAAVAHVVITPWHGVLVPEETL
ncbi:nitrite reductase [Nocardioides sp.]|uniref:nitrite reductase n=1 Tax=Nocardioides sp. TaxID=35761 RepID=UPI002C7371ED|nr:nitrite reductase [Nocardioides sp.]HXH79460.1 nitrite reductase [Nocardioides sp.]